MLPMIFAPNLLMSTFGLPGIIVLLIIRIALLYIWYCILNPLFCAPLLVVMTCSLRIQALTHQCATNMLMHRLLLLRLCQNPDCWNMLLQHKALLPNWIDIMTGLSVIAMTPSNLEVFNYCTKFVDIVNSWCFWWFQVIIIIETTCTKTSRTHGHKINYARPQCTRVVAWYNFDK